MWLVTATERGAARAYGSGSLWTRRNARGGETWYGQVRVDGRVVRRALGPKRAVGSREGLTRVQAEKRLRELIQAAVPLRVTERVTLAEAGAEFIRDCRRRQLATSTVMDYESCIRVHLAPFFAELQMAKISERDVEQFMAQKLDDGKAPKSVTNWLGILHSIFEFAIRRGWAETNPCKRVAKPRKRRGRKLRFLDGPELEAVLRSVPADARGETDRCLFLVAAMTGLRIGELLGLRWRDVDWAAQKIRVGDNWVRGEFGDPKSARSDRAVPMAQRVARELELQFQRSELQADDDLVFPHPITGRPLDKSKVRKRFLAAVEAAGISRHLTVHDLRHTFGTRMAAAGVPLRTIQEWMGHADFKTTQIYAEYAPSRDEAALVDRAFATDFEIDAPLKELPTVGSPGHGAATL
jgi:integrase